MWRHYEHHKEPLLPRLLFYRRLAKHIFLSLGLLLCALFSGIAFLTTAGIVITPIAHRILHRLHLDDD